MHEYKIEIFYYTEQGAIGEKYKTLYADNPEQAKLICDEYGKEYQTRVNEDGEEVRTGNKKYKVDLYLLAYKKCEDKNAFFNNFIA